MLVLITARGGSTRVANKALRYVAGSPALAWAVEAAKRSIATRVVLSSDDDDILRVGEMYGATPLKRPAELASEMAGREGAVVHALRLIDGPGEERVCVISPCHPLRRETHINEAFSMLEHWDTVVTVTREPHAAFRWLDGRPDYDPRARPRSQDVDLLVETGAIYGLRSGDFLRERCLIYGTTGLLRMEPWQSIDVDDEWTLDLADVMLMRSILRRTTVYHIPSVAVVRASER